MVERINKIPGISEQLPKKPDSTPFRKSGEPEPDEAWQEVFREEQDKLKPGGSADEPEKTDTLL